MVVLRTVGSLVPGSSRLVCLRLSQNQDSRTVPTPVYWPGSCPQPREGPGDDRNET